MMITRKKQQAVFQAILGIAVVGLLLHLMSN